MMRKLFFRIISAFVLIALAVPWPGMPAAGETARKAYLFYVGTYTGHGSKGIYAYRFDAATGQSTALGLAAETDQPSFLEGDRRGRVLYAVNEMQSYQGQPTGAV